MVAPTDKPYNFEDGNVGTHYMGSYDNYAIPNIQDVPPLEFTGPRMDEAIKFDSPEDADYFAKNYKVGVVARVLTRKLFHSRGHKVMLKSGKVGRLINIIKRS